MCEHGNRIKAATKRRTALPESPHCIFIIVRAGHARSRREYSIGRFALVRLEDFSETAIGPLTISRCRFSERSRRGDPRRGGLSPSISIPSALPLQCASAARLFSKRPMRVSERYRISCVRALIPFCERRSEKEANGRIMCLCTFRRGEIRGSRISRGDLFAAAVSTPRRNAALRDFCHIMGIAVGRSRC